jgi:hypothetical protein
MRGVAPRTWIASVSQASMRSSSWLLLALVGCSPWKYTEPDVPGGPGPSGQTYKQAVQVVCDVDKLAQLDAAEPEELADAKRFSYLEANVDNPDGIYLRTLLSVSFGHDRECLLRDAQKDAGLGSCSLADKTSGAKGSD